MLYDMPFSLNTGRRESVFFFSFFKLTTALMTAVWTGPSEDSRSLRLSDRPLDQSRNVLINAPVAG